MYSIGTGEAEPEKAGGAIDVRSAAGSPPAAGSGGGIQLDGDDERLAHRPLRPFLTYALNRRAVRRERRAKTSAEAPTAVEEHLEMPYRIRRRPESSSAVRQQLTDEVSSLTARHFCAN
ncbi:hypothetical protein [Streptomyces chartreusis]